MKCQRLILLLLPWSMLLATAGSLFGQSQPEQQTPQPPAASTPTPVGKATPTPNAKPAKVWTNDDINALSNDHGVSVVGKNAPQKPAASTGVHSYDKDPAWYRQQLQPLEAEIDKLDAQIERTKAFLNGDKVNDQPAATGAYYGIPGDPQEQLKKLEDRRAKDIEKLNDLLDRARHNDIAPGDLR